MGLGENSTDRPIQSPAVIGTPSNSILSNERVCSGLNIVNQAILFQYQKGYFRYESCSTQVTLTCFGAPVEAIVCRIDFIKSLIFKSEKIKSVISWQSRSCLIYLQGICQFHKQQKDVRNARQENQPDTS